MDELSSSTSSPAKSAVTTRQSCRGGGRISSCSKQFAFCSPTVGTGTLVHTHGAHTQASSWEKIITLHPRCCGHRQCCIGCSAAEPKESPTVPTACSSAGGTGQPPNLTLGSAVPLPLTGLLLSGGCAWKFHLKLGCARGRMTQAVWCHFSLPALIAPSCNNWKSKNK